MSRNLRIAFFLHSISSDWNNGNAHFLRGLARALVGMGHSVTCWEQCDGWSRNNLIEAEGERGQASLNQFRSTYPELNVCCHAGQRDLLADALKHADVAIVHEWNSPELVGTLLDLRKQTDCCVLFHDTHHRASSSPEQIRSMHIHKFDGVLAFGETLRRIYVEQFHVTRVWTLHEAADTSVFVPSPQEKTTDVIWVGNWGDDERTRELHEFLIVPARLLADISWVVHGVRYPPEGTQALEEAGIHFGGYLSNLDAAEAYRRSRVTLHIPRQQYQRAMQGIPTIRVFEALATGIPLISAPWEDTEGLFQTGDYVKVRSTREMVDAIARLLSDPAAAEAQAQQGLETVLARHTCKHRAEQITCICEELLA
jgi:spore maturation protein CgeB